MNFKQFLEHNPLKIYGSMTSNPNGPGLTTGTHNDGNRNGDAGAFLSTAWTGSESGTEKPFTLPGIDLVKDSSKIVFIQGDKPRPGLPPKDPIKIILSNGRTILMTKDEFDRAGGGSKIEKGKQVTWELMPIPQMPKGKFYQVKYIH